MLLRKILIVRNSNSIGRKNLNVLSKSPRSTMALHYYAFLVCTSVILARTFSQDTQSKTSLDALIKTIFNTTDNSSTSTAKPLTPGFEKQESRNDRDKYTSCGFEKECVPRFLCKNESIVTDGTGVIDIRIDGGDCGYLEVCCDASQKTTSPIISPVPPVQHTGCGYRNTDGVGFRIVGDESNEAQFGEFPWMVAILREEPAADAILNLYECGGALISQTVVLTAAHCVYNRVANTFVVRAGEWDTQTKSELISDQDRRVQEIIVHEKYNKGSLYNDIAILIVESPFQFEENVRPICLPPPGMVFDNSRCFATGWGKDKFGRDGKYQVILKKIDLPTMPRNLCQTNLRTTRLGRRFELHESFMCAGGEKGKDTCKGDGGSPLVCPIPGEKERYFHAGIVAWGIGCGDENIPGVYANVAYLRPWIDEKLSKLGTDFSFFTP